MWDKKDEDIKIHNMLYTMMSAKTESEQEEFFHHLTTDMITPKSNYVNNLTMHVHYLVETTPSPKTGFSEKMGARRTTHEEGRLLLAHAPEQKNYSQSGQSWVYLHAPR